ncbi:hypothetical protein HOB30_03360 [Candidatus Falkowbacteria bacterium]|jgi:hypothetical protein|nr:hypothetical protein [Candidatus Falkowbacteria bacterium]
MRKPSTLWHLENYSFTYNNEDRLVLQLVFRQCGFNRIMMNKLHVIQIPVFNHAIPSVNTEMDKAILRSRLTQHQVYGQITEMMFSRARLPQYWIFDKHNILFSVFSRKKDATEFCETDLGKENYCHIWKPKYFYFEYRGKPMSVVLGRDDEDYNITRTIPFLSSKNNRFAKDIRRGFNDRRSNEGSTIKKHKSLMFALQDSSYKLYRWWVFNSQMQPGSCHVSRDELINRLRRSPCMQ